MTTVNACPRCGEPFACCMGDAAPCPCTTVATTAETLARLRERYVGCLCVRCLGEEAAGEAVEEPSAAKVDGRPLSRKRGDPKG